MEVPEGCRWGRWRNTNEGGFVRSQCRALMLLKATLFSKTFYFVSLRLDRRVYYRFRALAFSKDTFKTVLCGGLV
ncbi:hypothetical protein MNBD_ALPHA06-1406 [hydrothermal vent metagenome]|uniref:Uncharacterized protein n=1 Tax=hydrothermal vent metagenome TaxID=652676 RepID=A0A3B0RK54_9ZZZZ